MSGKVIKAGTKIHLSHKGYYSYYYVSEEYFIAECDIPIVRKAEGYIACKGKEWKGFVLSPEELKKYPRRDSNLVWVKGDPDEYLR